MSNNIIQNILETEYGLVGITFISLYICVWIFFTLVSSILKEDDKQKNLKKKRLLEDIKHFSDIKARQIILERLVTEHSDFDSIYKQIYDKAIETYELNNESIVKNQNEFVVKNKR